MKRDELIVDFIRDSKSVLEDASFLDDIDAPAAEVPNQEQMKALRSKSLDFINKGIELQLESYFDIVVGEGDLHASINLFPPEGDKPPIDPMQVSQAIEAEDITTGVSLKLIQDAISRCNTERVPVENVPIAHFIPPIPEREEHLEILDDWLEKVQSAEEENGQVDHRDRSPFRLIKKGQDIARLIPGVKGEPGFTVKGRVIPFRKISVSRLQSGRNTLLVDDRLVADCDGLVVVEATQVKVNPVLRVDGNIGYKTGHVSFPGDVIIEGEVARGFHIQSGGSIHCSRTLDATQVVCEENLIVKGGIIGSGESHVNCRGKVETKFIENCEVESISGINVETGVINSSISTKGVIRTGRSGVLIGGRISAMQGILTSQIGSQSGPRTEVYCGTDFEIEQKLVAIRDRNIELAVKLKGVKQRLQIVEEESDSHMELLKLQEQIQEQIHKLNDAASSLVFQLDKSENARIIVSGTVFPGSYIEICHMPFVVNQTLNKVCFRLLKEEGRVVAEPLKENPYRGA